MTSLPEESLHAHAFLRPMFAVLKEGVMGRGGGGADGEKENAGKEGGRVGRGRCLMNP